MSFASRLATIIGDVVKEQGLSSPQKPMSAELHRFIDGLLRKAKGEPESHARPTGEGHQP